MPPKKVEPPPPPAEPEPEGPKEPDPETIEAATEVLKELINVSFAGARNRELDNKRVPYVVNRFMQQFETIVPLYFTSNDAGINGPDFDPAAATDATLKTAWDVEPEASQPPLDYWSRDDPGAEWTKSKQLLCRGPEHLQPKFRKAERSRRLALELEPDPEQRKINALRVVLQKERELAQAEIAKLEKKFAKSDFFYSKGALESKASVSDFFYRELGEPVEKSKPNHAKMQPQPNYLGVSELEKGLLPGQKPEPPPAPAKKRQPPHPTTKKEDGPLEPEELAKLEAAAIKAAQEHLLKTVAAAREANGKASYTSLGSRQPPLRETMKAAKGVRLVPDHVLVAELLGNTKPPSTAPSPNRKPVSFETKTKSAPELVDPSLSGS